MRVVIATHTIELIPKDLREDAVLVAVGIVDGTNVEHNSFYLGFLCVPTYDIVHLTGLYVERHWRALGYGITKTLQCLLAPFLGKTVIDVFQEMRFTRTIIAIDPNAGTAGLVIANVVEYLIEVVDDFIGEDVFINFQLYSFLV